MKDKREMFRTLVKWTGLVVVAHLIAMICFGIFMSSSAARYEENDAVWMAHRYAFWFSVIIEILLTVLYSKISASFVEYRRAITMAMKEEGFSVLSYYKKNQLREDIWRIVIVAAFQLPFTVFYAFAGISYSYSTFFDTFYIMDGGYYAITGSPILGLLFGTLAFTVIFMSIRLLFLRGAVKDIKKI